MFIRLKTSNGEINLIASNIVSFAPVPGDEGSSVHMANNEFHVVSESCRVIRNQLRKLGSQVSED